MNRRVLAFSILFSIVSLSFRVQASNDFDYPPLPNAQEVAQKRTLSNSSRCPVCPNVLPNGSLNLLVPSKEVVHLTTKKNPSLYFHSKFAINVPLGFNLVNPQTGKTLVERSIKVDQPGIQQIPLPASVELEPNVVYLWNVVIPCANSPETVQEIVEAAIKRVDLSQKLIDQLEKATSFSEKTRIFAKDSIWHDALDEAVKAQSIIKSSRYLPELLADSDVNIDTSISQKRAETALNSSRRKTRVLVIRRKLKQYHFCQPR